jgi:predicted esterase
MKKIISIVVVILLLPILYASNYENSTCEAKGDDFIFAGGECLQIYEAEGDRNDVINIIVHGTWKEGTNTIARYSPYADDISLNTDITSIVVSLPGYSKSSNNNFESLSHKSSRNLSGNLEYINFVGKVVQVLKDKYNATTVNYIGHSAAATIGASLTALNHGLINNIVLAGGSYNSKDNNNLRIGSYLNHLDTKARYLLIYGTNDSISIPEVSRNFYKVAKKHNLDVKIVEAKDAVHIDLEMTNISIEAISTFVE